MVYSHLVTRIYLRAKCRHQYHEHMGSIPVPGGIRTVHLFLSCEFCLYCLRRVSCMPNVADVYALSVLGCLVGFLWSLFNWFYYAWWPSLFKY